MHLDNQEEKHLVSIAPMMDWTDRHYRFLMRQLTKQTLLYTEMVTTTAIEYGDVSYLLEYDPCEHPIALQLGGDNPQSLAHSAKIAESLGYDEINLNVGCPSERVQKGSFGACLMANPHLVKECIEAMKNVVDIPVTIKHRIGIDHKDSYSDLAQFIEIVSESAPNRFTVHARKAWLNGLSPKQNRTIPPLRYDDVYRLKADYPHLTIEINGGIKTLSEISRHLQYVDSVMIGRAAYYNPTLFYYIDEKVFNAPPRQTNEYSFYSDIIETMCNYTESYLSTHPKARLNHVTRHMLHLFDGRPGSKRFRRTLSEEASKQNATPELIQKAFDVVKFDICLANN